MSTSSTNATGLPDRRRILSTLAGASALGLPAIPTLAAVPEHLDAELLDLDALLTTARARSSDLGEQCDEAYDRFVPPPMPEPLFWRKSDFMSVWVDKTQLDSVGNPDDDSERYTYASDGVLQSLKARRAEWLAVEPIDRMVGDRTIARIEEIIAHLEDYEAEEARCLAECGFTAADQAIIAQGVIVADLSARLVAIPARTPEGVCVKARAALSASYRSADLLDQHQLQPLLAKVDRRPSETAELLGLSAMIDAARLGPTFSGERRAA